MCGEITEQPNTFVDVDLLCCNVHPFFEACTQHPERGASQLQVHRGCYVVVLCRTRGQHTSESLRVRFAHRVDVYVVNGMVTLLKAEQREDNSKLPLDTLQKRGPKAPISLLKGRGPENPVVRRHLTKNRPGLPQKSLEIPFPGGDPRRPTKGSDPKNRPRAATRKPTKRRSLGLVSPRLDHSVVTGLFSINKSPRLAWGGLPPATLTAARSLDNAARALNSLTCMGWDPSATLTPAREPTTPSQRCEPEERGVGCLVDPPSG